MQFFIDTANIEAIKKYNEWGVIDGVTTNPSLIAKEGANLEQRIKEIAEIVDGPISAEVIATTYKDMIGSGDVDAVVIATPDHWHAPISIEALNHNVHVYVEKPMTHTVGETYLLRDAAKNSKAVLAVGHQHRQTLSFSTAKDIVEKGTLGHVSLIQTNTNRNDDNGAWNYDIHEKASPETIDWEQFLGSAPKVPFNKNHFFRWRKWWAYGSGLSGDLLTHDYDRLNCVLHMGIPSSVSASGGIYTHNDGRNVPDVIQVNMEFPDYSTGSSQAKGKEKIGSTLKGIGPAYTDKAARKGLRVGDLDLPDFEQRYQKIRNQHLKIASLYQDDYRNVEIEGMPFESLHSSGYSKDTTPASSASIPH